MDIKSPINSFVKNIEQNAKKVFSSSAKDNEGNRSPRKNFTPVRIKEEETDNEIQEYAATTMSELLGWYGYDKVDSGCTKRLNLDHFTSNTKDNQMHQMDQNIASNKLVLRDSVSPSAFNSPSEVSSLPLPCSETMNRQLSSPVELKTLSFDSTSKFPYQNCKSSTFSDNEIRCSWCGRTIKTGTSEEINSLSNNTINALRHFCSEDCFIAGRRAVFKQAKTCDWCRHIRNPISYVGFQDSESPLQFCSDRCLNQYKINIFCHETQTHLMLQGLNNASFHDTEKGSLITPELWFKNCQSPLNSPTDDTFVANNNLIYNLSTPVPNNGTKEMDENTNEGPISNPKISTKKDSIYMKQHSKSNNCNEKKNFHKGVNESDVNECVKEQTLANEGNKCCHFMGNQNYCSVNVSQTNDYKSFKENCNLMGIINYNLCNHQQNDSMIGGKNIQEKDHNSLEDILRSSPWFSKTATSLTQCPLLPKTCTHKLNQTLHQNQIGF